MDIGLTDDLNGLQLDHSDVEFDDDELNEDDADIDLIRAKRAQRERPITVSNMSDIKSKFETGHSLSKEERREERKQEIQNIRSRLFMGKQAKIKEMYQQAVADSEQGIYLYIFNDCFYKITLKFNIFKGVRAVDKKVEVDIGDKARSIKDKFEKGEIYQKDESKEDGHFNEDSAVFEQGNINRIK